MPCFPRLQSLPLVMCKIGIKFPSLPTKGLWRSGGNLWKAFCPTSCLIAFLWRQHSVHSHFFHSFTASDCLLFSHFIDLTTYLSPVILGLWLHFVFFLLCGESHRHIWRVNFNDSQVLFSCCWGLLHSIQMCGTITKQPNSAYIGFSHTALIQISM